MPLPTTRKILWVCALLLSSLSSVGAAQPAAPSDVSIRELLKVTRAEEMAKSTSAQLEAGIQAGIASALGDKQISEQERSILNEMAAKMQALLDEATSWKQLEPLTFEVYKRTFTQSEVDGMLAFYKTEAGKALINKMPVVLQNSMQLMEGRLAPLMPKLEQIQNDTLSKLEALKRQQ